MSASFLAKMHNKNGTPAVPAGAKRELPKIELVDDELGEPLVAAPAPKVPKYVEYVVPAKPKEVCVDHTLMWNATLQYLQKVARSPQLVMHLNMATGLHILDDDGEVCMHYEWKQIPMVHDFQGHHRYAFAMADLNKALADAKKALTAANRGTLGKYASKIKSWLFVFDDDKPDTVELIIDGTVGRGVLVNRTLQVKVVPVQGTVVPAIREPEYEIAFHPNPTSTAQSLHALFEPMMEGTELNVEITASSISVTGGFYSMSGYTMNTMASHHMRYFPRVPPTSTMLCIPQRATTVYTVLDLIPRMNSKTRLRTLTLQAWSDRSTMAFQWAADDDGPRAIYHVPIWQRDEQPDLVNPGLDIADPANMVKVSRTALLVALKGYEPTEVRLRIVEGGESGTTSLELVHRDRSQVLHTTTVEAPLHGAAVTAIYQTSKLRTVLDKMGVPYVHLGFMQSPTNPAEHALVIRQDNSAKFVAILSPMVCEPEQEEEDGTPDGDEDDADVEKMPVVVIDESDDEE